MSVLTKIKNKLTSFQIIILGFAGIIVLGALILMLPIATQSGECTPFGDAFFTATSAVCVTGLVVRDTATYWSSFGQAVILIMIQIGGLGVITVASIITMIAKKKISLMQRQTMQNALSAPQLGGIVRLTRFIFCATFFVEGVGVVLLLPVFVAKYGVKGIWMSVFHSISAFCNAGFDLMGDKSGQFSSLTSFAGNGYLTFVISMLIVIGGIGFLTWNDFLKNKLHFRKYRMQSKVIIVTTFLLIILPAIFFFFVDYSNEPTKIRICKSVFQAVTPKTAGFNTADYSKMSGAGMALTMMLMLVGGSPGSTAGGMKTTTVAILFASAFAVFRKKKNAACFGRRIDDTVVKNASAIFFMYITFAMTSAIIISLIEKLPMKTCMFETFSAVATVGLSLGATPSLGVVSHIILMVLMFIGRVGGLTIVYAAFSYKDTTESKYPLENIMIG